MKNPRFWAAVAAVYVVHSLLGFLIHEVMLADVYQSLAHVWRPKAEMESMMWIMFVSSALWLTLFCWIYTKGYEGKGVMEGVRYGLAVGTMISLMQAYDSYVIYPIPYSLALTWFLSGVVVFAVCGAVLAAAYKPLKT